jgi:hypothetical protein
MAARQSHGRLAGARGAERNEKGERSAGGRWPNGFGPLDLIQPGWAGPG